MRRGMGIAAGLLALLLPAASLHGAVTVTILPVPLLLYDPTNGTPAHTLERTRAGSTG